MMDKNVIIRRLGEMRLLLEMTSGQYAKYSEDYLGEKLGRGAANYHKAKRVSRMMKNMMEELRKCEE